MEKINYSRRNFLLKSIVGVSLIPTISYADSYISVDTIISKLAAVGIPGLVILAVGATSTYNAPHKPNHLIQFSYSKC